MEALTEAGFSKVEVLKNWGATYTIKATKICRYTLFKDLEIRKCTEADAHMVGRFYEDVVIRMQKDGTNYPKWKPDYPSVKSVTKTIKEGTQYFCLFKENICGAFVLNQNPEGAYEKGQWKSDLKRGDYLVIHTLAVDQNMKGRGIGSAIIEYCIDYAKKHAYKAIRVDVVPTNFPARRLYIMHVKHNLFGKFNRQLAVII